MKEDEPWVSESEEGDIPDGPQRNSSYGGLGAGVINLREAMAQAKLPPIEKDKGQTSPHVERCPSVGVATRDHHGEEVDSITLSDWDDEEEETKPHPSLHSPTHIPAVIGASRELSGLQHETNEEGGGKGASGEEGEGEGASGDSGENGIIVAPTERAKVTPGMELGHEDESILSSESELDLPLFGGYTPSNAQTATCSLPSRLPPNSQGSPQNHKTIQVSAPTSPTTVTPLSISNGMTITDSYIAHAQTVNVSV